MDMTQKHHVMHGRDHSQTGADPAPRADSTENVGLDGVQSVNAAGNEVQGYVLTALGDGGSTWAPALASLTDSPLDFVRAHPCGLSFWPMDDTGPGAADAIAGNDMVENPESTGGTDYAPPVGSQGSYNLAYQQPGPFGANDAIHFDGSASGFHTYGAMLYRLWTGSFPGQFTIGGWVKSDDADISTRIPLTLWGLGTAQTTLHPNGLGCVTGSGTFVAANATSYAATDWHHICGSYDGTTIRFYFDGVLQDTVAVSGSVDAPGYWRFGGAGNSAAVTYTNYWKGLMSAFALFECALTDEEIATLVGLSGSPIPAGSVPVADGAGGYTWGDHGDLAGLADDDHPQYVRKATLTTKGDLYAATAAGTIVRVGAGTDGQRLTSRASATPGVAWEDAATFDPTTATSWWFPLIDSDGTCVLDSDGNLIPTLIPL